MSKFIKTIPPKPSRGVCSFQETAEVGRYVWGIQRSIIGVFEITPDEYLQYQAENYSAIFPEYDPSKHDLSGYTHGSESQVNVSQKLFVKVMEVDEIVPMPFGIYELIRETSGDLYATARTIEPKDFVTMQCMQNIEDLYTKYIKEQKRDSALMYGPPGNGKTTAITNLLSRAKEDGVYVFIIDSNRVLAELKEIKDAFAGKRVIFILEEITEMKGTASLLNFLDGIHSWPNVLTIATTNYPEELQHNVIDRPGRFNHLIEVDNPDPDIRLEFALKRGLSAPAAKELVQVSNGMSIDYLNSIIKVILETGESASNVVANVRKMREKISKNFRKSVGI